MHGGRDGGSVANVGMSQDGRVGGHGGGSIDGKSAHGIDAVRQGGH
jgi:hypothetical protein